MSTPVAVILAAGRGTRLHPLTATRPKVLVPIAGKSLLQHNIERVSRSGIDDIIVVVGEDEDPIRRTLRDGSHLGVRLRYVRQWEPLGTAHAMRCALPLLNGDPFLLTFGDNMTPFDLGALVAAHDQEGHVATLGLKRAADPTQHGVVELHGDHVVGLEEKPEQPKSDLTMAGMYVFEPAVLEAASRTRLSDKGEYYLPDTIQLLIGEGHQVGYVECTDWRTNVNTPDEMLMANEKVLTEGNRADPSQFSGGTNPPNYLAPTADLSPGCEIGPYVSVGEGAKIGAGARIENCILLAGVHVGAGAQLKDGVFGENCRIAPGYATPTGASARIYAGDNEELC